jgi:hypothetical protein
MYHRFSVIPFFSLALLAHTSSASAQAQGPASSAIDAWFRSMKHPLCVSPDGIDVPCTNRNSPRYTVGYAHGGAAAIAFVRFRADTTGNAENLEVATFRNAGGQWAFVRKVEDIFGHGPDRIKFEGGKAVFRMEILRDGDSRCCPTGTKRHAVQIP